MLRGLSQSTIPEHHRPLSAMRGGRRDRPTLLNEAHAREADPRPLSDPCEASPGDTSPTAASRHRQPGRTVRESVSHTASTGETGESWETNGPREHDRFHADSRRMSSLDTRRPRSRPKIARNSRLPETSVGLTSDPGRNRPPQEIAAATSHKEYPYFRPNCQATGGFLGLPHSGSLRGLRGPRPRPACHFRTCPSFRCDSCDRSDRYILRAPAWPSRRLPGTASGASVHQRLE